MRAATDRPAFCRVTLLTPGRRVDVALPVDVPLAELVPMVLELIGEPRRPHAPVAWRFSGATGGPLPPGATLAALRVMDGELLRLGPHVPAPAAPVFDDPVDAVAATAGPGGASAGPALRAGIAVVAALVAAGLVVLAAWAARGGTVTVLAALLAAAGVVACMVQSAMAARAAETAARYAGTGGNGGAPDGGPEAGARAGEYPWGERDHARTPTTTPRGAQGGAGPAAAGGDAAGTDRAALAAVTAAVCAVPLAAAAGWAALPGPPGSGQLLLAAAAAGTVAAIGQVVVRVIAPVLVAIVVATAAAVVLALLRLWFGTEPAALAAGAGAVALAAGPLLPRLALRLAGLPQPSVPADVTELVADDRLDRLPPAELADRADLARGFLAGLVAGTTTVIAAAAVPLTAAGGWYGPILAIVTVLVAGLRSRGFADTAPARASLVAALAGTAGVATVLAVHGGPATRLGVAAAVAAVAVAAVALARAEPVASPVSRRAVDVLENVLLAATVPLALAVMDVYALVRGL